MKINLLGAAALSLLCIATSCDNEIVEKAGVQNDNTIKFQTVLGKQTKASEMTTDGLKTASQKEFAGNPIGQIPVIAFAKGTNNIFNEFKLIWNDGGYWEYTDGYSENSVNQPGYELDYYSIYPSETTSYGDEDNTVAGIFPDFDITFQGVATFGYIVYDEADDQKDLIAATTSTDKHDVTLEYKHLLSQINFAIKGVENVKVNITNINVNGVKNTGTYTFNGITPGWGSQDGEESYIYAPCTVEGASHNHETTLTGTTDGTTDDYYFGNGNGEYSHNNALMLMPQEFTTDDANFSFDYKLYAMEDVNNATSIASGSATANFKDIVSTSWSTKEWVMGKRYLYVIDFTEYLLGLPIKFSVEVKDWVNYNGTDGEIDVPASKTAAIQTAEISTIEAAISTHEGLNDDDKYLTTFPIAVSDNPSTDLTFALANTGFDPGDKIVITFTDLSAHTLALTNIGDEWDVTKDGNVITLEKKTRNRIASIEEAANATIDDINNAISTQADKKTTERWLTVFPITVTADPANLTDLSLDVSNSNFISGDKIIIEFEFETADLSTAVGTTTITDWDIAIDATKKIVTLTRQADLGD